MTPSPDRPTPERARSTVDGWTVHEFDTVVSTNPIAGALPPWHAVRADRQTGGRGRTGRVWVSDLGGLWLSAALPTPGARSTWAVLPLAAGWAVIEGLRAIGARDLRLRWPNDILVGRRKLAGLLVEQFRPDAAVVGIGVNVSNAPARVDATLDGLTITVSDLAPQPVSMAEMTRLVLAALRRAQETLAQGAFAEIARAINQQWDRERRVQLTLNDRSAPVQGRFTGVDAEGRLTVILEGSREARVLDASQVALLREID